MYVQCEHALVMSQFDIKTRAVAYQCGCYHSTVIKSLQRLQETNNRRDHAYCDQRRVQHHSKIRILFAALLFRWTAGVGEVLRFEKVSFTTTDHPPYGGVNTFFYRVSILRDNVPNFQCNVKILTHFNNKMEKCRQQSIMLKNLNVSCSEWGMIQCTAKSQC